MWCTLAAPQGLSLKFDSFSSPPPFNAPDFAIKFLRCVGFSFCPQAPTQFTVERLLKEKAAVLSESSLVNTILYRKEQAQLSKLHNDTILPSRFPIGDMQLLRSWTVDQVRKFFARFYRPENATLFIVGDVAPRVAFQYVDDLLGALRGDKAGVEEWCAIRDQWQQTTAKRE